MSAGPLVSAIVPTRNAADSLRPCLESLTHQSYPYLEILVVDNHSTDATLDIARALTPLVYTRGPERSAQRNAGARAAHGSYLVFLDSDMVLDPTVIERCVQKMWADAATKGIIIPERSVGEGFWARCKALERSCYVGDDSIEAARFFDRAAFDAVGGYDETLTAAEDWDLSQRVAQIGSLGRINAYITHLEGRLTLQETMRSKFYYGRTLGRYVRKQPGKAVRQLQLVRPAFVRHWRWLLAHPVLTAGMVVMKTCEFAAGGAGLALASYRRRGTSSFA
jgi:glycosyltransferase involved in cell wall biosynthesis